MELRVLKYFLMVAREENITKAAQLLHITQPTLSRQLMLLEEELGTRLFLRGRHNITLTDDGLLLKRRAQEIVGLVNKTEQEFSQQAKALNGEIMIGCGETCNMALLADWMTSFREQHPLVQYNIYSATAEDVKERLESGLLDIGLLMEPVEFDRYDFLRMPYRERWGILTRYDSPLAEKQQIRPADLLEVPLIISRREQVQHELAAWFGSTYEHLQIAATFNLFVNAAIMVKHYVGTALILDLGTTLYDSLRFIPLAPQLENGAVLGWKKNLVASRVVSAFINHIQQYPIENASLNC